MLKLLDRFEEGIILVLFPAMVLVVFVATTARYFDLFPMFWGEELARYIMVYLAYTGAGLAMKRGAHISIGFIVDRMKNPRMRVVFDVIGLAMALFFTGTIIAMMVSLVQRLGAMGQTSPTLRLPIWTIYAAVPYGMFLVSVRAIQTFVVGHKRARTATGTEDA